MKITTMKKMKRVHGVVRSLNKEYDVVTKEMIMMEGRMSKKTFTGAMEGLKRKGDVYSAKHGQFIAI